MTIGINTVSAVVNLPAIRSEQAVVAKAPPADLAVEPQSPAAHPTPQAVSAVRQAQVLAGLDARQRAAETVKHAFQAIGQIGTLLGRMQQGVQQILKQYPPYPLESQERMELLKSIAGLRKQIDALTFPPPDSGQVSLIGRPGRTDNAGDLEFELAGRQYTLHAQPLHSGEEGLDLPVLGDLASDEEVQRAAAQLTVSRERLGERGATLAVELDAVVGTEDDDVLTVLRAGRADLAGQDASLLGGETERGRLATP